MRSTITILIIILSLNLFGLVRTKLYVQNLDYDIKKMEVKKEQLHGEVQVLRAEWSYLNRIDRLESLSSQYLGLKKISMQQIKRPSSGEGNKMAKIQSVSYDNGSLQIKKENDWRYKPRIVISKYMNKNVKK
jgi:hypothetical protein